MIPSRWTPIAGAFLLFLAGCGRGNSFEYASLCPATGTLMINREPAAGAMLIFVPTDGKEGIDARGTRPHAVVAADGKFQITSYVDGDGIPVGDYQVAVIWEDKPNTASAWDKLGGKYARSDQTGITVTVHEGENSLEPIMLEKVRILDRPPKREPQSADGID